MTEFADAIQDETIDTTPPPAPERDTYEELIEEALTDEDKAAKRERLETVDREIIRLEEEKKAAAKVFTNQIKPLQAERDSILEALDAGTEKRRVEVYDFLVIDPSSQEILRVEVRRVDTDAKVDERAATAEERRDHFASLQGDLFDGGGSQPPPADLRDPADDPESDGDDSEDFEPTAEALAQAAEDEQRVVRTSSKDVKAKKTKRAKAAAEQGAE
jgi:hypothetical protein